MTFLCGETTRFSSRDILATWIRPLIAEMIGPFVLVSIGAGAIMTATGQHSNDNYIFIPRSVGFPEQVPGERHK